MKITKKQETELLGLDYKTVPKGAHLNLYQEDFEREHVWKDVCDCLGLDYDTDKITIAYIGVKGEK